MQLNVERISSVLKLLLEFLLKIYSSKESISMMKSNDQIAVERSIYWREDMMISTEKKKELMRRKIEMMSLEGLLKAQKYKLQNFNIKKN